MKSLLALLLVSLFSLGVGACGGSSAGGGSGSASASATRHPARDRDDDGDKNDDDAHVLYWGRAATGADQQAITTLIKRYYAAAAAEDGAQACSLLVPFVAEAVPENYGHQPGLHGRSCAVVMSKFFRQRHHLLA